MLSCFLISLILIIHEMLRKKARQHNTAERQSNTTQLAQGSYFSKKKLAASGGSRTHDRPLSMMLLPTELPRQLSWLGSNHIHNTKQPKHLNQSTSTKASQTRKQEKLKRSTGTHICTCMHILCVYNVMCPS